MYLKNQMVDVSSDFPTVVVAVVGFWLFCCASSEGGGFIQVGQQRSSRCNLGNLSFNSFQTFGRQAKRKKTKIPVRILIKSIGIQMYKDPPT